MELHDILHPPMLTSELPGIGGRIKVEPEDFEVEEIPAYEASGEGEFLYLWVQKRDMSADYFVRQVAKRLDMRKDDVGTAGLKDRRAVTRQWISLPADVEPRLGQLDGDGISVLEVSRHRHKLRSGHLRGNRFRILIRDLTTPEHAEALLSPIVDQLKSEGLANFYGPQRFGHGGQTLEAGMCMLRGEKPPKPAESRPLNLRSPFIRKLVLSAAQSGLFNVYLAQRMRDGLLHRVLPGAVMNKLPMGGIFVAEDVEAEQARFDQREIVTAGPIFGKKTFAATGEAAEREAQILQQFNLTRDAFTSFGKLAQGTRRHNIVYLTDLSAAIQEGNLLLTFTLPTGSYATVLLREIMKTDLGDDRDGADVD